MSQQPGGQRRPDHKASKSAACIYCPPKNPFIGPVLLLLFLFSPVIFPSQNPDQPSPDGTHFSTAAHRPNQLNDVGGTVPARPVETRKLMASEK